MRGFSRRTVVAAVLLAAICGLRLVAEERVVALQDASRYVGESVTVEGDVSRASMSPPSPTTFDIHIAQRWPRTTKALGVILFAVGLLIIWKAAKVTTRLKKYEFEHRTGGGVVGFETFEDSVKHDSKKGLAKQATGFGCFLILIAIFVLTLLPLM